MPNNLHNTTSPYLLQHANNPVDWFPRGEEALKKSKDEDKPIFLSIGYAVLISFAYTKNMVFKIDYTLES